MSPPALNYIVKLKKCGKIRTNHILKTDAFETICQEESERIKLNPSQPIKQCLFLVQ